METSVEFSEGKHPLVEKKLTWVDGADFSNLKGTFLKQFHGVRSAACSQDGLK